MPSALLVAHLKPTTECLRGVATYPTGESTQGRYKMNLSDLQNDHYAIAVREAMMDLILGRSDNIVEVGDVVEMLLSISFGVKDSMLDWQWSQDASASSSDPTTKKKTESVSESHEAWFTRVTNEGQDVLWHPKASAMCPTLLTGIELSDPTKINTLGWEDKLETANLEKHAEYLRERQFVVTPHPLEATAWENGFVPETQGLPSDKLCLTWCLRHWLRDWQSGFGGYTKVYEYQVDEQTKRMYSVANSSW